MGDRFESLGWLAGGGEMGARLRAKDWSATPLGPAEHWSQSVKAAVSLCLNSSYPIILWLGPEVRLVYNDACIPFFSEARHPGILGTPGREALPEIWDAIAPMHREVAAGRPASVEDQQMFFARRLPREEIYSTFVYSPIFGLDGRTVEGVFSAGTETTEKVVGQRRLITLRDLAARPLERRNAEVACKDAAAALRDNPHDVPFAAIYLLDDEGTNARLVAGTRLGNNTSIFPENHSVSAGSAPWPLGQVLRTRQICQVSDLPTAVGIFSAGPWPDPVETVLVLPLTAAIWSQPFGFLIIGASPRRVLDADYRSFLELIASQVASTVSDARAFEAEHESARLHAEAETCLQAAVDLVELGRYSYDPQTHVLEFDSRMKAMWGLPPDTQVDVAMWHRAIHPDDHARVGATLAKAIDSPSPAVYDIEYRVIGIADGIERWIATRGNCEFENDKLVAFVGVARDVTERKRSEQTNLLLIAELQHRTRNLLAVVMGIATDTIATSTSLDAFSATFRLRIAALSRVQGLLSRAEAAPVTIGELIRLELGALGAEPDGRRVIVEGPDVALPNESVQILALAVHELATNARKHGALAVPQGRLAVTWRLSRGEADLRLTIDWRERGAHRDRANQVHTGFGRTLIERALPYQLDAQTQFEFTSDGIFCSVTIRVG